MQQPLTLCGNFEAESPLAQARSTSRAFAGAPNRARALPCLRRAIPSTLAPSASATVCRLPLSPVPAPWRAARTRSRWRLRSRKSPSGSGSGSSTNPPSTRRTVPRQGARAASALARRCRSSPRSKERYGLPVTTDVHEIEHCAARRGGRRHSADPGLPVPADRPPRRRRQDRPGGERQEGPVPRPLGHGERGAEDHRRRQSQGYGDGARRLLRL